MKKIIIGVFDKDSNLRFQFGDNFEGNELQAELLVEILDQAQSCLNEGDYFAWEYKP